MSYAKVKNNTLIKYPYTFQDLQNENPYTNYGNNSDVAYWYPQTKDAIENEYTLANVVTSEQPSYDQAHQSCTLNNNPTLINNVWTLNWTVADFTPEQQAAYNAVVQENNKITAVALLQETDWTSTLDISNPEYSNPYLMNQEEFLTYRNQVRQIAVNPPITPAQFPEKPQEQWSN